MVRPAPPSPIVLPTTTLQPPPEAMLTTMITMTTSTTPVKKISPTPTMTTLTLTPTMTPILQQQTPLPPPSMPLPTCSHKTDHLTSGNFIGSSWHPTLGGSVQERNACELFAARRISLLLFAGDSMARNLAIDTRQYIFNDSATPSREDCWQQRNGFNMENGVCREGFVCGGQLRIRTLFFPFAEAENIGELEADLSFVKERTVVLFWYSIWYLIRDNSPFDAVLDKIQSDTRQLLAKLQTGAAAGSELQYTAVIGPIFPWCELPFRRGYCPRQGPENMSRLNEELMSAVSTACVPYFNIFELSQKAGTGMNEGDGTHTGTALNIILFKIVLQDFYENR